MQFTTPIVILKSETPIDYNSKIVSIGSCFAKNMGAKFDYFKFNTITNPFGIIFNPISIENVVFRAINEIEFTENDIFFHNERWQCYEVHSVLSNQNKEEYLLKNDPELYACLLNNLGNCYLNSKNYKNSPNLFIKAERIFDSLNIQNEQSISNIYLSNYYCKIKDTLKAITYCKKSLQIAKQSKANNYYFDCP